MSSLLITHGYVVTVDPARRVISDGYVAVDGDAITAVGPMGELPDQSADEVIDARGMLVMPGLVNGHNHHWGSLFKNTGEGMLLEEWIDRVTLPLARQLSPDDLRVAAYLAAIEQIRTGTTCSLNHAVNINDGESMAAMIEPVLDVGVRQLVTKELRDTPDPPFSDAYPARPHVRDRAEERALAVEIVDRWDGAGGIVHMGLALETGANWMLHNSSSEELILEGVELAERRGLKITNHCGAGTPWLSHREFERATGGGDVDFLVRIGALAPSWVLIHVMHVRDREIDAIGRAGIGVITAPVSNAYNAGGVAPLKQFFAAGVPVGLGSDGTYVNCSPDMVEQMKFAVLIQNLTHMDPRLMTAESAIEMATIGSARAMGLDHLIGSLEPGKRADIVLFDLDRAHSTVANRPVAALVFSAHGNDADTVIVNGQVLLRGGELAGFDREREVLDEATARAHAAISRAELADQVFVDWRHGHE
jgi:5-methylthioadenosine/S-adenosylhomocysteine deaminase